MYLVYDYVEKGSLRNSLKGQEGEQILGWRERVMIIKGIADALSYMHHDQVHPIVHRDLSTNNILLDFASVPKVSDFGTARLMTGSKSLWSGAVGSIGYMAPGKHFICKTAIQIVIIILYPSHYLIPNLPY